MTLLIAPQLIKPLGRYGIKNAALFDGSNTYMTYTPGVADNRKKGFFCGWVSRASFGSAQCLLSVNAGADFFSARFEATDEIGVAMNATTLGSITTLAKFRDPWPTFIVVAWDTAQATAADRLAVYVLRRGVLVREPITLSGAYWGLNDDTYLGATLAHDIGRFNYSANQYFSGLLAETKLVFGQSFIGGEVTQSDLIGVNAATGNGAPKRDGLTYSTHSAFFTYANTPNLGENSQGNDWTVNGAITQVTSTPTKVYATLNPLNTGAGAVLSGGNLVGTNGNDVLKASSLGMAAGIFKAQVTLNARSSGNVYFGIIRASDAGKTTRWNYMLAVMQAGGWYDGAGNWSASGGMTISAADVLDLIWNADTGTLKIYKNNTLAFNHTNSAMAGTMCLFASNHSVPAGVQETWVFNSAGWTYAAQDSAVSLCTDNLPAVTGKNVNAHFKTVLFEGTRATQSISGVGFQPGFIWAKRRDGYQEPSISDAVRGVNSQLRPAHTAAASAQSDCITSFDADGFTLGADNTNNSYNYYLDSHVAWVANLPSTAIPSGYGETISLAACCSNTTLGMAVVTYTGNGIAGATIPHPLAKKPGMVIVKKTNSAGSWVVQHSSVGATGAMFLETTDAVNVNAVWWNNAEPTATLISLGTNVNVNANGSTYIAYIFAPSDFIKIGSYVGNGLADGPFINSGILPVFDLSKSIGVENWVMLDDARPGYNPTGNYLFANLANPEGGAGGQYYDFTATGRKIRTPAASANSSGVTYVYLMIGQPTGGSNIRPAPAR